MARALRKYRELVKKNELRPLTGAEHSFAQWLAAQPRFPSEPEILAEATDTLQTTDTAYVKALLNDPAFQRFYELCVNDVVGAGRKKLEHNAVKLIDVYLDAIGWAHQEHDYRAIAPLIGPAMDRLYPAKKQDSAPTVAVQVVLNQRQQAALDAPSIEVTAEPIVEAEPE